MTLSVLFNHLKKKSILVAGDFMVDTYTVGSVQRVSPEAPVIVVNANKETKLPGGAGNVVLNLLSLGAKVIALGRLGDDLAQKELLTQLKNEKAAVQHLYIQKGYQTPVKNRIIAGNQQIARVDFEKKIPLSTDLESKIISQLPKILKNVSVVAISDYAKGFLSKNLLKELISHANAQNIPVIVDPKGVDFEKYAGAYLIKPNLGEAYTAAGFDRDVSIDLTAQKISQKTQIENVMITKSGDGISLFRKNLRQDFSVKVKEVTDVTGAGDTVLAVLTFAVCNNLPLEQAAVLCNLAAAEVIEHLGCARITIKSLAELILDQKLDKKVFSKNYLKILQFLLDHEEFILLKACVDKQITPKFFSTLKEIQSENKGCKMVVYLENDPKDTSIIDLLASLSEVDFIITKMSNLQKFCEKHEPKKIYDFMGDKIKTKKSLLQLLAS